MVHGDLLHFVHAYQRGLVDHRVLRPGGVCGGSLGACGRCERGGEPTVVDLAVRLTDTLSARYGTARGVAVHFVPLSAESHATVYHPAALWAFRAVLAPPPAGVK